MSLRNSVASAVKNTLRLLTFNLLWIAPAAGLGLWHEHFLLQVMGQDLVQSQLGVLTVAITWWCLSWVLYMLAQTLWPALMLIFFRTERERSPKRIIQIGERFRKVDLPSPQIFIIQENLRLWKNSVWGFFVLPSPLGALLLIEKNISESLAPDEYDHWMCRKVIESRFYRFSSRGFLWWSILPTWTLIGYACGNWWQAPAATAVGFGVIGLVALELLSLQRERAIDDKAVYVFNLQAEKYLATKKKCASVAHVSPLERLWSKRRISSSSEAARWFTPWIVNVACPLVWLLVLVINVTTVSSSHLSQTWLALSFSKNAGMVATKGVPETRAPAQPSALSQAVVSGDLRGIIRAMAQGGKLREGDPALGGATPLLLAVRSGDLDMVFLLLSVGSNLRDEVDGDGRGALFYALEAPNRAQVVQYLLGAHLNINQKSRDGLTAYDLAVKNGWQDVASAMKRFRERQGSSNL